MSGTERQNNSRVIQDKHIFIVVVVISFIITITTAIIYVNTMPEFKLHEIYYKTYPTKEYEKIVSFDSTNKVKLFSLQKEKKTKSYLLSVCNLRGVKSVEFKINALITELNWTTFCDVNDDGYKDIIIFYQRGDSLFQAIFDEHNKEIISEEKLILLKPEKALHRKWYIHIKIAGVLKDSLNEQHLIFTVYATSAIYPRSVYDYNLFTHKLERQFDLLSSPRNIKLFDINKDGKKEIIVSAISTATVDRINDNNKYDFFHSWLIVLNQKLKPLFTLKKGPKFSSIEIDTLSTVSMNYIVAAYRSPPSSNFPTELFKVDSTGKIVNKAVLKTIRKFNFFVCDNKSVWFSFGDSVKIFDTNLKIIHRLALPSSKIIGSLNVFSYSGKQYYIAWASGTLFIFNEKFKLVLSKKIEFSGKIFGDDFSLFKSPKYALPYFMVSGKVQGRIYLIVPNEPSYITFFIFFAMWILLTLVLFYSKILIHKLLVYYLYFVHSSSKSSSMIILIDNNKKIKYLNKVAKEVFCKEQMICEENKDFSWLKGISKELFKFIDIGIKSLNESTAEFTIASNSQILRVKGTFTPFKFMGAYPLGYYCSLIDLSKSIEAERAKVYSHSIQKVAHEIKTPLNSLLFTIKSLEFQQKSEEGIDAEEFLQDIKLMENEVKRIKNLTNNLLKFANLQKPHFKEVKIERIISDSIEKFETYRGKGVEFIITGIFGTVFADEFQMKEAFQVLLENSIDAMKANGRIHIVINKERINDVEYLKIMVSDEGPGIPEDIQDVLFDPYVTTKLHGTGMGLAIAQKIVEDHGSKLVFKTSSEGTIFSFYLKCINCGEEE